MKLKLLLGLALLLSQGNAILAQSTIKAIATYKSKRKMEVSLEGNNMTPEMKKQVQAMINKQSEKEYELLFDQNESTYAEVEELETPQAAQGGAMVMIMDTNSGSLLYKNLSKKTYASEQDLFGKVFLIEDKMEPIDWKLSKETKKIGQYTCYKATYTKTKNLFISKSDSGPGGTTEEKQTEEVTVTAWYTPEIPVAAGPEMYWGLPGLIMEVNTGKSMLLCAKIVINPEKEIEIKAPKKGKKVTKAEYERIVEEKMKDLDKQNGGPMKKGEGHSFEIEINN